MGPRQPREEAPASARADNGVGCGGRGRCLRASWAGLAVACAL